MEFQYRGVRYAATAPSLEVTATTEQGTFLGARFNRKHYHVTCALQPAKQLRFLGQSYSR